MKRITLSIFLLTSLIFLITACQSVDKGSVDSAYLFAYFTGNGPGQEAIHYAVSRDGLNYYALNNDEPIIDSKDISATGGVRDPHILEKIDESGYYMVVTDLMSKHGWHNTAITLMKSDDLITWSSTIIDIPQTYPEFADVNRAWAPQTIYDDKAKKYMVYFSMLQPDSYDKIYYAYVNDDFTKLESAPKQLFFSPDEKACIDGDIIQKDDKFYLFYKTEGTQDKGIKVAVSDSLTSGYVSREGNVDQTDRAVEGSGVFQLTESGDYILMYDMYIDGRYQFAKSSDLLNFEALGADKVTMNFTPRHGTVIPISENEAARLLAAFPSDNLPYILNAHAPGIKQKNIVNNSAERLLYIPVKPGTSLTNYDPELETFPGVKLSGGEVRNFEEGLQEYQVVLPSGEKKSYNVDVAIAANPVLEGYYADPEIIYSNQDNKFYLYPTSDGFDSWSGTYFKTFSSEDLVNWKDEGIILDLKKDVAWADRNAWAPCIAEKKTDSGYAYYYYYTAAQKIGVAVADDPAGPFKDIGQPLIATKNPAIKRGGGQIIDPDVFTDPQSGKTYLYYGNGYMAAAELNEDMISIKEGSTVEMTPDGTYREGTEVFFRDGKYYFLWSEDDTRSPNYKVRYALADSPLGPLEIPENNIVIQKNEAHKIYATGHNSVIQDPKSGEWYIVYHRFTRPRGQVMGRAAGFHREVAIDKLTFSDDGWIVEVNPSLKGPLND